MNGKHTPGPWKTRPSSTFNADIVEPVKDLGMICIISTRENQEDEKANAALIAAVPELLEALDAALTWWHSDTRRMAQIEPAWLEQARAAIRKATGQE